MKKILYLFLTLIVIIVITAYIYLSYQISRPFEYSQAKHKPIELKLKVPKEFVNIENFKLGRKKETYEIFNNLEFNKATLNSDDFPYKSFMKDTLFDNFSFGLDDSLYLINIGFSKEIDINNNLIIYSKPVYKILIDNYGKNFRIYEDKVSSEARSFQEIHLVWRFKGNSLVSLSMNKLLINNDRNFKNNTIDLLFAINNVNYLSNLEDFYKISKRYTAKNLGLED